MTSIHPFPPLSLFRLLPIFFLLNPIGSVHNVSSSSSSSSSSHPPSPPIDPEGYLMFCLCMGRLGNQMEHFLGALEFAKRLNRTLVLPPFTSSEYRKINWNEWFQVKPLRQYHRVILADSFMKLVAPRVWPVGRRVGFCYTHPSEEGKQSNDDIQCDMEVGGKSFWESLRIDFDSYVAHSLSYQDSAEIWRRRYPASDFPVVALRGAPAPFPMKTRHWHLQKYVRFSEDIEKQTDKFVKGFIGEGKKFVGVHLRNGGDWDNACRDFLDPSNPIAKGE